MELAIQVACTNAVKNENVRKAEHLPNYTYVERAKGERGGEVGKNGRRGRVLGVQAAHAVCSSASKECEVRERVKATHPGRSMLQFFR